MVHAQAGVTVSWNTRKPRTAPAPRILRGTLIGVNGRTASVKMADGSVRTFEAAPQQLPALRERVGYSINFIVK